MCRYGVLSTRTLDAIPTYGHTAKVLTPPIKILPAILFSTSRNLTTSGGIPELKGGIDWGATTFAIHCMYAAGPTGPGGP
jgi:hypothetical protein